MSRTHSASPVLCKSPKRQCQRCSRPDGWRGLGGMFGPRIGRRGSLSASKCPQGCCGLADQPGDHQAETKQPRPEAGVTINAEFPRGERQFAAYGRFIPCHEMVAIMLGQNFPSPAEIGERDNHAAERRQPDAPGLFPFIQASIPPKPDMVGVIIRVHGRPSASRKDRLVRARQWKVRVGSVGRCRALAASLQEA